MSQAARPPPPGVVPDLEHPEDVLHTVNIVTQILSLFFVSSFTLMRLYTKTVISPPLYLDDWVSIPALLLSISYAATGLVMAQHGGGYHVWEITANDLMGFNKGLYADTLVYGPNSFFTKITLILMVTRVFATSRKTVIVGHVFIVLMLCYYLPVLIIKAQICRPIEGFWDEAVRSSCFNQRAVFVADTVMSALSDTAVLCLPIPLVLTLRMTWKKRLRVLVMLSAGGVATAFSIARLVLVFQLQGSSDDPVDFVRFNLLGTAEISIGVICGCFPAVNILIRHGCPSPQSSARPSLPGPSGPSGPAIKFLFGSRLRTQRLTTTRPADIAVGSNTIHAGDLISRAARADASQTSRGPTPASWSRPRMQARGSELSSGLFRPEPSGLYQPEPVASPPHGRYQGRRGSACSSSALVAPETPTSPPPPPPRRSMRQDQRWGSAPIPPRSPGSPTVRESNCIFPIERRLSFAAQQPGKGSDEGFSRSAMPSSTTADGPGEVDVWYELVTSPTFHGLGWEIDVELQAGRDSNSGA
ncbi:hypothetical protein RB597_002894 [Gaeumannomyces tritici]